MQKDLKLIENPQLFYGCLHFRYNKKKYLYGVSQELLTYGEENGLLKKMNGTYQPSQRQKKDKSTLQIKKQKIIMKINYIILPRKAFQSQYLWYFENMFDKLDCRHFLILTENQQKSRSKYAAEDYLLKRKLITLLKKENQSTFIENISTTVYKVQMFRQHENVIKKGRNQKQQLKPNKTMHNSAIQNILMQQVDEIYDQDINEVILELCRKQTHQYQERSIFKSINPFLLMENISVLLNQIRHNSNYKQQLQLTNQQIQTKKQKLSQQILRISSSQNVIYPTQSQQAQFMFLPLTTMIGILHKHNITLINPSNLASWKLHHLHLPVSQVKQIILTRFCMSFLEFIITWSAIGVQQKVHSFLQIITLDWIYEKIKQKLYQLLLWDDEMIFNKIAFRVIPQKKNHKFESNTRQLEPKQQFFTLRHLKLCYQKDPINQQSWIIRFGDKQILFLNQLVLWKQQWLKRFHYIIFDKIKQDIKNDLYEKSKTNKQIGNKCVYNRSSSSKYRNKYLYCLNQTNPIIKINSLIRMQQTFVPYQRNEMQLQRYHKVKLYPGQSINCLDRNIVVIEGLVAVTNEFSIFKNQSDQNKGVFDMKQTYVWLCWGVDLVQNGRFSNLSLNKIRRVRQLIALKQCLILVEELQDQEFYDKHQLTNNKSKDDLAVVKIQNNSLFLTQKHQALTNKQQIDKQQLKSSQSIPFNKLEISDLQSNTLIKLISRYSANFHLSYKSISNKNDDSLKLTVQIFSPLYQFSKLFKKVTLQSGHLINQNNQKVYFVIKGLLKWKNFQQNQILANNQSFIGNIKCFYQNQIKSIHNIESQQKYTLLKNQIENQQQQIVPIEVIKDTWALEADLSQLHQKFFVKYPQISYWMITKGKIFY